MLGSFVDVFLLSDPMVHASKGACASIFLDFWPPIRKGPRRNENFPTQKGHFAVCADYV